MAFVFSFRVQNNIYFGPPRRGQIKSVGKKPAKVADNMAQKLIGRWHRIRWLNAFVMLEDLLNHASLRQSCPIPAHCQAAYARIVLAGAFAYTHGLHMGFVFYPDRTVDG
jgi:hypothetical protein